MESRLECSGNGGFGDGEALDTDGQVGPFGAFQCENELVDIVQTVGAAGEGGFDRLSDGERAEDVGNGLIEKGIGNREQSHEEEVGLFIVHVRGVRELLAEVGTGEGGTNEFGGLSGGEGHDGEDGDPAAKFAIADESEGMTDAADFRAKTEERGIEIAKQTVEERRFVFQKVFDGLLVEFGRGDKLEKVEVQELVAGNFTGFDHGGLAEEIALKVGIAKTACFCEFVLCFDFLGEELDRGVSVLFSNTAPAVGIQKLKIDFKILGVFDERREIRAVNKVIEREGIPRVAEALADVDDFVRGRDGLENFNDDAIGGQKAGCVEPES